MIRMLAAFGIAAMGGGSVLCPICGAGTPAMTPFAAEHYSAATIATPVPAEVTLRITGMTCGGCVLGVRKVLTRLDGVTSADVSYEKGSAIVRFDPSRVTTAKMIAAIKTLGYTAVVAS
jgi:copper chaperone